MLKETQQIAQSAQVTYHPTYGPALPQANWVPAPRYLLRRDRVLRHIWGTAPCRVLDIGCGPAALLSELATRGFSAFGVDRAPQALELAQQFNDPRNAMTLQAGLDPAWLNTFDLVFSFEVIEHLEQDVEAMADWLDYLKPGGRMILSTPAHPSRWNAADVWAGHVRRYTREGLTQAVIEAGFEIETLECYGFPLANLMEKWRARAYAKVLQQASKSKKSMHDLTNDSGSDRSVECRFWPTFASRPVAAIMRLACQIQRPFLNTDLGNGYLIVARKR